jgi:uridine kinase
VTADAASGALSRLLGDLAEAIPAPRGHPVLVGISGIDGVGKTRFTDALARRLRSGGRQAAVVHLDDFHHPRAVRRQLSDRAQSYIRHAFDLDTLVARVLSPLRARGRLDASLRLIDLAGDARTLRRRFRIGPDAVVLIEGVLLFRPPVDAFLGMRILVDMPPRRMVARLLARDGGTRVDQEAAYRDKLLPVRAWFWRTHRPVARADAIIDNTDPLRPRWLRRPGLRMRV